jgi:hypothetical protein
VIGFIVDRNTDNRPPNRRHSSFGSEGCHGSAHILIKWVITLLIEPGKSQKLDSWVVYWAGLASLHILKRRFSNGCHIFLICYLSYYSLRFGRPDFSPWSIFGTIASSKRFYCMHARLSFLSIFVDYLLSTFAIHRSNSVEPPQLHCHKLRVE